MTKIQIKRERMRSLKGILHAHKITTEFFMHKLTQLLDACDCDINYAGPDNKFPFKNKFKVFEMNLSQTIVFAGKFEDCCNYVFDKVYLRPRLPKSMLKEKQNLSTSKQLSKKLTKK